MTPSLPDPTSKWGRLGARELVRPTDRGVVIRNDDGSRRADVLVRGIQIVLVEWGEVIDDLQPPAVAVDRFGRNAGRPVLVGRSRGRVEATLRKESP